MLDLTADFGVKSKTQIWRQFLSEDGRVELDLRGGALGQPTTTTVSVHTPGYICTRAKAQKGMEGEISVHSNQIS